MDTFLGFLSLPAQLSAASALRLSSTLSNAPPESPQTLALALAFLSSSWTHGQQRLAKHLLQIRQAQTAGIAHAFLPRVPYRTANLSPGVALVADAAHQAAFRWAAVVKSHSAGCTALWAEVAERLAERLALNASDPESVALVMKLREIMAFDEVPDFSRKAQPLEANGLPHVPRTFQMKAPSGARGQPHALSSGGAPWKT